MSLARLGLARKCRMLFPIKQPSNHESEAGLPSSRAHLRIHVSPQPEPTTTATPTSTSAANIELQLPCPAI